MRAFGKNLAAALAASTALAACATTAASSDAESADVLPGAPCRAEPRYECGDAVDCPAAIRTFYGPVSDIETQRAFFLDYPCDYKEGEEVTFILNIHGFGSIANWQRSYFPALDQADGQRLVVATPSALQGQPTQGRWTAEADDKYLANITDMVIEKFGRENITSFWLAGHSQGGATSHRIVCSDYFASKVDGLLSMSGGRTGSPNRDGEITLPTCAYSHIYAIGEREAGSALASEQSAWAERFNCGAWTKQDDVVDTEAGYVTASDQSRGPSWGTTARPGTAEIHVFENCDNNMLVADIVRLEKGHTEGFEPRITEMMISMMRAAPGGKIRNGG